MQHFKKFEGNFHIKLKKKDQVIKNLPILLSILKELTIVGHKKKSFD